MVRVRHPTGATSEPADDWLALAAADSLAVALGPRLAAMLDADDDSGDGVGEIGTVELGTELGEESATACTGGVEPDCARATNTPAVTARTMRSSPTAQRPGPCRPDDPRAVRCRELRSLIRTPDRSATV